MYSKKQKQSDSKRKNVRTMATSGGQYLLVHAALFEEYYSTAWLLK